MVPLLVHAAVTPPPVAIVFGLLWSKLTLPDPWWEGQGAASCGSAVTLRGHRVRLIVALLVFRMLKLEVDHLAARPLGRAAPSGVTAADPEGLVRWAKCVVRTLGL